MPQNICTTQSARSASRQASRPAASRPARSSASIGTTPPPTSVAGIREKYHCLIAGVERGGETLHAPDPHEPFVEGDVVWVVGESADVYKLVGRKCEGFDMG